MILNNLKKPLERKHLLSKLFLVISLSLISVFQTEAQYIIEEERLQEIIKSENPNLERIREIIEQKPWIIFAMDKDGNTPLHDAARYGHVDVVTLLLRGANVESWHSSLCCSMDTSTLHLLLDHGNVKDQYMVDVHFIALHSVRFATLLLAWSGC